MSGIYRVKRNASSKVAVVRDLRDGTIKIGESKLSLSDVNPSLSRFKQFWDLMETIGQHGYLRAAMSTIGRSAVGAWWSLRRHQDYPDAPDLHKRRLYNFYMMRNRRWDNIKDFQNIAYKLMIGAMYLRYFGQAAYSVVRDEDGRPVGLDFLHGLVIPNVDSTGAFKPNSPAFVQYTSSNPSDRFDILSPSDVVYLINPDWNGSPMGGSDIQSLSDLNLPIDIYLQVSAREYLKNRDKPEVVYEISPDISDDAFDAFVKEMEARRGTAQMGRNPIAVQGEFKIHELRPYPNELPYQSSRKETRDEALAAAGVSGAKLGLSDALSSGNLRELRREFHEASMSPLFRFIELGFYEQVHLREFGISGWEFKFDRPDFLTEVEQATVHMRYRQMGVLNPNEIRFEIGKPDRTDPDGDEYIGGGKPEVINQPGSPPEGREEEPDSPSEVGEPTLDDQDPPRGDQHDDEPRDLWLRELRQWRRFTLKRMAAGKTNRPFNAMYLPDWLYSLVTDYLSRAQTLENAETVFDDAIKEIEESIYGEAKN